jgi:hypothetical protein
MSRDDIRATRMRRLNHGVIRVAIIAGIAATGLGAVRLAVIPAAVLFGWSQLTGL